MGESDSVDRLRDAGPDRGMTGLRGEPDGHLGGSSRPRRDLRSAVAQRCSSAAVAWLGAAGATLIIFVLASALKTTAPRPDGDLAVPARSAPEPGGAGL